MRKPFVDPTTVTPGDLVKVWSLSKSSEYRQMTLRVPADVFYKLQALERMFPTRSRNEMASDLLTTALDQFADGLGYEAVYDDAGGLIHEDISPALNQFWDFVSEAKKAAVKASESEEDSKKASGLKVVGSEAEQAA